MKKFIALGLTALTLAAPVMGHAYESKRQEYSKGCSLEEFLDQVKTPVKVILWTSAIATPVCIVAYLVCCGHKGKC